jgi:methylenetetrahydrofolate dehydrogenase (NADP+)/methenyltetrahydrofolate cyclohydrolase
MRLINGQDITNQIYQNISQKVTKLGGIKQKLMIVAATADAAAAKYLELKVKAGAKLELQAEVVTLPESVTAAGLIARLTQLAIDPDVGGLMLQLPLYSHLQSQQTEIINTIPNHLDVDGLTATNLGLITLNSSKVMYPATVKAILHLLNAGIGLDNLIGKQCLVINHSALIGKPLSTALLNLDATVTIAHKHTVDLVAQIKQADIVISATGQKGLLKDEMFKLGAGLIDVTSIATEAGVVGDYEVENLAASNLAWRTPVPGGVGPVTVACLWENFVDIFHHKNS